MRNSRPRKINHGSVCFLSRILRKTGRRARGISKAQAATTMPIMAPLADILGISRQTAVLAFQYGDGFSNLLWPTTLLPVVCSIAKIPIQKWWRYFVPFFGFLIVAQMIFIAASVMIGLA